MKVSSPPVELGPSGHFAAILDGRIATADAFLRGEPPGSSAVEARDDRLVPRRRLEFWWGRDCARRAMAALGHPEAVVAQGRDRAPIWPEGLVGSITHTDRWAVAAVARRDQGVAAIGIDLEPWDLLPPDLWASVCTPEELENAATVPGVVPGLAARLLFSIKEAVFKCQYPLSHAFLDFADIAVDLDAGARSFVAVFQKPVPPFGFGQNLRGRFAIAPGHIATAVVLTSGQVP